MSRTLLFGRAIGAVLASCALSGCLVNAPDCKRCGPGDSADGGVNETLGSGGTSDESQASGDPDVTSVQTSAPENSAVEETADTAANSTAANDADGGLGETDGAGSSASTSVVTDDTTTGGVPSGDDSTAADSSNNDTDVTSASDHSPSDTAAPAPSDAPSSDTPEPATSTDVDTSSPPETTTDGESSAPQTLVHETIWHEGFEDGLAQWTVEGAWAAGEKSNAAAPDAKDGSHLVGTGLEAAYHRENSRLLSPKFIVPPANRQPYLRYWYWYQLEAGDTVQLQVRVGEAVTWVDLQEETDTISTVAGHGSRWMQALLPLEEFGDQEIQLSFALTATGENCTVPGFFIDNVSLETGPMNICSCQGFNNGNVGDWSIEGGQWGVGASSSAGAPAPQSGNGLAGTNLETAYESLAAAPVARLSSPTFTVANRYQSARFYLWYSFAAAGRGKIQWRVLGEKWADLVGPEYEFSNASSPAFTFREIELEPWVGQTVQFGFLIENGAGVDTPTTPGFYIDEFYYIE